MQYVQDSFESGWITTAFKEDSYIGRFEQSVREYLGGGYPVALQSGTAAIHLALRLCGVEKEIMYSVQTLRLQHPQTRSDTWEQNRYLLILIR
jgi:dTDP-4-amino-4,6-dideoxygalactose transaminase